MSNPSGNLSLKRVLLVYPIISIFFILMIVSSLSPVEAGDYHIKGKNLYCSDCHTLHFSQDGQVPETPTAWGDSPEGYLLKNITSEMCLMCHDGDHPQAPDVIHPASTQAPDVGYPQNTVSPAGYFATGANVDAFGHSLNLSSSLQTESPPPPGYKGEAWDKNKPFSCVFCHDPHGNIYYRNLREKLGMVFTNLPVTYSLNANGTDIQQLSVGSEDHYAVNNIIYRQEALSNWCAGCHTDYKHGEGDKSPMGWELHPTGGITMSSAESVDLNSWIIAPLSRPPVVTPRDNDHGSDQPFCGTCHKAHGSSHNYGLLRDNSKTNQLEDGQMVRETCQACHNIGGGYYEISPHGDKDCGVTNPMVKGFAKGECEQCHRQHGLNGSYYKKNLFTHNNNSLCLTVGCHLEEPSSYPLADERLPVGAQARITMIVDGKDGRGYFEANNKNDGRKLCGLEYRGRWPGGEVYQDDEFSPHSREPMPDNASCKNCHSPHGTGSPFDMLKDSYSGTGNSHNFSGYPDNYQLCFNCHSQDGPWAPPEMQPIPGSSKAGIRLIGEYYNQSINNDTYSGHQIRKSAGSASFWPEHIKEGDKLACSNCHNPHGSRGYRKGWPNAHLLSDERADWYDLKDTLADPNSSRNFCFGCHIPSDKTPSQWGDPTVEGIIMATIPDFPAHRTTSDESCHNCHGDDYSGSTSENVHHPSPGSCNGCHADQGIMAFEEGSKICYTGPHAYHTDVDDSPSVPPCEGCDQGKGRKYAFACEMCHAKLNTQHAKTIHGNGRERLAGDQNASLSQYAEVSFYDDETFEWKSQSIHQRNYRYRSLYHNPYDIESDIIPVYASKGYDNKFFDCLDNDHIITWSDQSSRVNNSCTTIWCHSNANPLSLSNDQADPTYRENRYQGTFDQINSAFFLTWHDDGGDRCDNCHGFTDIVDQSAEKWSLSSLHRKHIGSTGKEKIACGQCHALTCELTSNTIWRDDNLAKDGYFYHVNGQKDVVFSNKVNPGGKYDDTTHTCSNLYCHPKDVSWTSPETLSCASCHAAYANDKEPAMLSTAGHFVHLSPECAWGPRTQCGDCHNSPSYAKGDIDTSKSNYDKVVAKTDPGWVRDMWKGYTVLILTSNTSISFESGMIAGNTNNCLSLMNKLSKSATGGYYIVAPGNLTHCDGEVTFKGDSNEGGTPLTKTKACDKCHSQGGDYDGVNGSEIGAKKNWQTGVYIAAASEYKQLAAGKEKWCVGCHDKNPAASRGDGSGITAPNVAGDETLATFYGQGYGYFKTGHGLDRNKNYPASREEGAGAGCTDCHDVGLIHIDHDHRTYLASSNNYRLGYRLQMVQVPDGDIVEPMDIPRTWYDGAPDTKNNDNPLRDWRDFALCFKCHDRSMVLGDAGRLEVPGYVDYYQNPVKTNFYNNDFYYYSDGIKYYYNTAVKAPCPSGVECFAVNLHTKHLEGRFLGKNLDWTSSWSGTEDSSLSCPACHNVHGSSSPRMMRHGELISTPGTTDAVPGINFNYLPYPPSNTCLVDSTGGEVFSQYKSGPGQISKNKICNTCHMGHCFFYRSPGISTKILLAEALNSPVGGIGIDDGDQLVITFDNGTNGPEVVRPGSSLSIDLAGIFKIYQETEGMDIMKSWGSPPEAIWLDTAGHENDTIIITLADDATIAVGDRLEISSTALKDFKGFPIISSKLITGSFDCSIIGAYAEDNSGKAGIQADDQVTIEFLGVTAGTSITAQNIDQALLLNNLHSWLDGSGQIKEAVWTSKIGENDTLTITLSTTSSPPSIAVGDLITLGGIITDKSGGHVGGSILLQGSFDPPVWYRPTGIYDYSEQGPPGFEILKSIDGDFGTYWHPAGSEGWVVYDLAAKYQVYQVRIFSNTYSGGGHKASVSVWVSDDPSFSDPPLVYQWPVDIEYGWQELPAFDLPKNGRYLKIEGKKIGTGPLTHLFSEIEFKGLAPPSPPS